MTTDLDYDNFVRKPFVVEALEVTKDNIALIAPYIGDLEEKNDGTPYIAVDRRLVPNIPRVYPGFYMTRMGDHIRCYSRRVFFEQFTPLTGDVEKWIDFLEKTKPTPKRRVL